jgi:hypothetical protein
MAMAFEIYPGMRKPAIKHEYREGKRSGTVNHDGTLNKEELGGRASVGTMTKDDYLSLTETRFKLADPNNDGTLDAKELESEAGQDLLKLLK